VGLRVDLPLEIKLGYGTVCSDNEVTAAIDLRPLGDLCQLRLWYFETYCDYERHCH
jgi:hypothetical protein